MAINGQLGEILRLVADKQLGPCLTALENYLLTYSSPKTLERLNGIKEDYQLMVDYWQRGFQDPKRQEVYQSLLQRAEMLATDQRITDSIRESPFMLNTFNRCRASRRDWSLESIRQDLENYVSEQALIELKPEHTRAEEQQRLNERHQKLMSDLFDYLWTSHSWSERASGVFAELLLSPTVDTVDQQLLVGAVTLSLLNTFDFQKLRVLMHVYSHTTDEHVRQRALVGWALGIDSSHEGVWPEMLTLLRQLTADERCRQELKELQMQLVYCLRADEDSQKVQREIIPEIIKNNDQFRVTRNGIEEIEEDSLEDILHPELSEQRMEKMEATINRMVEMQRAGSDIYYGGFAQMKRYPFFNDTCNWLMPFNTKHPALREVLNSDKRSRVLLGLIRHSPFCDSDAYSFAFGFHQTMSHMPKNMLEMMDRGELSVIGEMMTDERMEQPAYIRRKYLQDLYRFFRLFPSRSVFDSPFDLDSGRKRLFFFQEEIFSETPAVADCVEVAAFLAKQRRYQDVARKVLQNCTEKEHDERYYLTLATLLAPTEAVGCYREVLKRNPQHEYAMKGLARGLFSRNDFQGALDIYEQLLALRPDSQHFLLNKAICLGNLRQYDEALKILYKMNYEQPDSEIVNRVLAWTLVGDGKQEQAVTLYEKLLEAPQPEDYLNYGFCRWLDGDVVKAVDLFRQYAATCGDKGFDAMEEFHREEALLQCHGISDVEIRLMADLLTSISLPLTPSK